MAAPVVPQNAPVRKTWAVLAIFILSGAAGLVYEIVWARQLVLVFGNTTQAVSTILTGFFGGMAIGAAVGGRIADRAPSPLRMYGILELILVPVVLITPLTFGLINDAYRALYPSLQGTPWLTVFRLVLSILALAPATILMGATFPSLVRHFARDASLGAAFGRLYSANTLGAVVGTVAAGFFLIELFGLQGALRVGALCSATAGVIAIVLARGDVVATRDVASEPARPRASHDPAGTRPVWVWLPLLVAFASGLTSLGYQVTWTRLLSSGTGSLTYVFTVILALFLIGIAIGAALFSVLRGRIHDPVRVLGWSQFAVAILSVIGLTLVISQPRSFNPSQPLESIGVLILSAVFVVLPVTIVMGLAFPTASELLRDERATAGKESGSLLAVNTVGAILGSLLIPFLLMPTLGSPSVIVLLAGVNVLVGVALFLWARPDRLGALVGAGLIVVLVALALRPGQIIQPNEYRIAAEGGTLFESREDEIASVQAGQTGATAQLWVGGTAMTLLTIDAKLMPILPLIARPASERALVVAFGMGSTFRSALIAGLRTDAVELVPSVPAMFPYYYPDADQIMADPDGRVFIADGRNHLELSDERFDIIVTDPPPPIQSSGVSVIASHEYFLAGRDHLTEGGVMMQWTPWGTTEAELKEHIRTFSTVFDHVLLVQGPGRYGFYMLGSMAPIELAEADIREVLARPGVLEDISTAYDSPATTIDDWVDVINEQIWFEDDAARAYAGEGPLITDDQPRPEYFLLRALGWLPAS
jgi:spermidine synthase